MKYRWAIAAFVISGIAALSCAETPFEPPAGDGVKSKGSDGGGNNTPTHPVCVGQETTIKGKVTAPNGVDPVPGASVFIPRSVPELFPPAVKCEVCGSFGSSDNLWFTTTQYDGTFELSGVCPGPRVLVFQNGRFRRVIRFDVPASTTLAVPADRSRLPRRPAELDPADALPRIAVVTGDYDKMECVLRKMGLADGSYDMYEGSKILKSVGKSLTPFSALLANPSKMKTYNIIFINCTDNTFEAELKKPSVRAALEGYVQAGGRLYITDWSYDWIEQLPLLAPFVDFEPGPSGDKVEPINAAALGKDGLKIAGTIKDPQMAQWLGLFPGAIKNGKSLIEHFLVDWVVMHKLHKDVKVWVEGPILAKKGGFSGTRPLTVTFNFKNCGKILFSSYHTEGRDDELKAFPLPRAKPFPRYCGGSLSPQDRILEYLIFDIASCVKPVQ